MVSERHASDRVEQKVISVLICALWDQTSGKECTRVRQNYDAHVVRPAEWRLSALLVYVGIIDMAPTHRTIMTDQQIGVHPGTMGPGRTNARYLRWPLNAPAQRLHTKCTRRAVMGAKLSIRKTVDWHQSSLSKSGHGLCVGEGAEWYEWSGLGRHKVHWAGVIARTRSRRRNHVTVSLSFFTASGAAGSVWRAPEAAGAQ